MWDFLSCGFILIQLSRLILPLGAQFRAADMAYRAICAHDFRTELVIFEIPTGRSQLV